MTRITVLVENTATGRGLLGEHGLSLWIERAGAHILLDTGQGHALPHNARLLNVPLARADAVVLSHGHYDHAGGLPGVLDLGGSPVVYTHPAALEPKYKRTDGGAVREIGISPTDAERIRGRAELVWTESPIEIAPGLCVTGPIPRRTDFEDSSEPFFVDCACQQADELPDDQALYMDTDRGTVIVVGCAHAGVINTIAYVQELTEQRPVYAVIGGMHLISASGARVFRTIEALRGLRVQCVGPAHCTGFRAMARILAEFPEEYHTCAVGSAFFFADRVRAAC